MGEAATCWAARRPGARPAGPETKAKASGMHAAAMAAMAAVFPEIIVLLSGRGWSAPGLCVVSKLIEEKLVGLR